MGLMIGICVAASGLGGMIFNPIGGWIIGEWGWRMAYYVFGGIVLFRSVAVVGAPAQRPAGGCRSHEIRHG